MMDHDARDLCGARYGRVPGKSGRRWGKTEGKVAFHGGKIEMERPRARSRGGGELALPSFCVVRGSNLAPRRHK